MAFPNKNTPECRFCIYASNDPQNEVLTCHYNPIGPYGRWAVMDAKDFCGKWRGIDKSYEDLFPRSIDNAS